MASVSTTPQKTDVWNDVCFPVESVSLSNLLPDHAVIPSDRQNAIVGYPEGGKPTIYAIQSKDYSIVPNSLLREVIQTQIPKHEISIIHNGVGEFSINVITPNELKIGDEKLYRNLIINNSYTGKSPFTIQGTIVNDRTFTETGVRVSYYRQICTNGLMGWADEWLEMDAYLNWLLAGKPKKHKDAKQVKENGVETRTYNKQEVDEVIHKKLHHYRLNMEHLRNHLNKVVAQFMQHKGSLTAKIYERLYKMPVQESTVEKLVKQVNIPVQLTKQALERMQVEERQLQSEPTMWLLYNAFNYSLMNSRACLSLSDRYSLDEKVFHELTQQTMLN